jgi:hypothetical protein
MIVEFACECGCGGIPREDGIEIGMRPPAGDVTPLGQHSPGHAYARPLDGWEWVARHPGGQWVSLDGMRQELRRAGCTNVTTRTGRVVHADGTRKGYPACGKYLHGIWYTDEPVNCPDCVARDTEVTA